MRKKIYPIDNIQSCLVIKRALKYDVSRLSLFVNCFGVYTEFDPKPFYRFSCRPQTIG